MAPSSMNIFIPRDNDPSLGELFHHFPAKVWRFLKLSIFGLALILAFFAIFFAIIFVFMWICTYGPDLVKWLKNVKARDVIEGSKEQLWRLRRIERFDRMWIWLDKRNARGETEVVDTEELRHLGSHEGEEREGSVGGETLFERQEDEDDNGQASKKEETELQSKDYMHGEA